VHHPIKHAFLMAYQFVINAQAYTVSNASDGSTSYGPQIDSIQYEKIKKYLEVGKASEESCLVGVSLDAR
jgi:acyl-CoA reductase-like NAD-dependent aldehyde dehydrogenase